MTKILKTQQFEDSPIRQVWDGEKEEYYFSIVDIIAVLTDSKDPTAYWRKLKQRLKEEGNETVTNCHGLKMLAADGKMRLTDVATQEQVFRLIQSIPSPKAEPLKLWLAQVGAERIDEMIDPEKAVHRGVDFYRRKGYSEQWINQRMRSIEFRKKLTDEWKRGGVTETKSFAFLTDIMINAWSDKNTRRYKDFKGLEKENLRDNMTDQELVLTMLSEVSATELSKETNPATMGEHISIAKKGGNVARVARMEMEKQLGHSVISSSNAKELLTQKANAQIEDE